MQSISDKTVTCQFNFKIQKYQIIHLKKTNEYVTLCLPFNIAGPKMWLGFLPCPSTEEIAITLDGCFCNYPWSIPVLELLERDTGIGNDRAHPTQNSIYRFHEVSEKLYFGDAWKSLLWSIYFLLYKKKSWIYNLSITHDIRRSRFATHVGKESKQKL